MTDCIKKKKEKKDTNGNVFDLRYSTSQWSTDASETHGETHFRGFSRHHSSFSLWLALPFMTPLEW